MGQLDRPLGAAVPSHSLYEVWNSGQGRAYKYNGEGIGNKIRENQQENAADQHGDVVFRFAALKIENTYY